MLSGIIRDKAVPYWSLSSFYFVYFALLGATFPYWSLYLEGLGFSPVQIGFLLAIPMATKIVAPGLWGWLADYTGQPLKVIRYGSGLACISFSLLLLDKSLWMMAIVICAYSFFWNAVLPQHEVITLKFLKDKPQFYSRIRLWGSIGFIVTVSGCGAWYQRHSVLDFPVIGLILFSLLWLSSALIPKVLATKKNTQQGHFLKACSRPAVISFLVAGCLLQVSHGVYYSFFSIYLESLNYSRSAIGMFWAVGVISEVVIFMVMHKAIVKMGVRAILIGSLVIATVRWFLIGHFADLPLVLFLAQICHAFTYGSFHAGAIEVIRRLFPAQHQSKGQSLYSSFSFGLGGALGSIAGGLLWQLSPTVSFDFAAISSLLAVIIVYIWLKHNRLKI